MPSPAVTIRPFSPEDFRDFAPLLNDSLADHVKFLTTFLNDWDRGDRFDKPGEKLLVAVCDGRLIGICGLNIDPFVNDPSVGRLRRMYVHTGYRRRGIAQILVSKLLEQGKSHFKKIRLSTENEAAARMYEKTGFKRITDGRSTHTYYYESANTL